jgi:RNA polymerase sigma-70 factor (ECF subfamily)
MSQIDVEKLSDEEVLPLIKVDKNFFGVLIRRYESRIIGYVKKMGAETQETAEDMAQNIFIKVYVHINSFKKELKFSTWLYGIARNECIDYWRKNKKHAGNISLEASEELMAVLKSDEDLAQDLERKTTAEDVRDAIGSLPKKYKEILILRFLEDRTYEDIALILRKPISSVGTLVRRARILFKENISNSKR